uniref:Mos1 transposase HTH domain-containing protein n=1 Tax=Acrobeloides nanus TaxID=290746 RepID=A0A914CDM4_9BILA
MMSEKELPLILRHCIWYEFKLGHNYFDAYQNLCNVFGPNVLNEKEFQNLYWEISNEPEHGRYWSLHEILCDIYEKDPKTTWLSDEPLINLPLWDVGTSDDHVTNYAPYMYSSFFQTFSANVISTWDDDAMDAYAEKFCHRVNNRVCTKIYVSPDEQSLQQRVGELVRKEDVQRDIFLSGFYAFLDQFMTNLAKEVRILKDNDLIPYYSNVWKNLLSTLRNIVSQLKSTFTEEQGEQFSQVLQSGIDSWRRIWFDTNKIPNKIKLFLENYTINQANLSEVITLEIIQSYKVLKLYDDGMTSNMESSITPLQCYQFIEYQHKKYLLVSLTFLILLTIKIGIADVQVILS